MLTRLSIHNYLDRLAGGDAAPEEERRRRWQEHKRPPW